MSDRAELLEEIASKCRRIEELEADLARATNYEDQHYERAQQLEAFLRKIRNGYQPHTLFADIDAVLGSVLGTPIAHSKSQQKRFEAQGATHLPFAPETEAKPLSEKCPKCSTLMFNWPGKMTKCVKCQHEWYMDTSKIKGDKS